MGRREHRRGCRSTSRPADGAGSTHLRLGDLRTSRASSTPPIDVDEYDPDEALTIGPLTLRFAPGRHYVPAWGVSVEAPDGSRLVYTGDTGPSETVVEFARGADLLLVEATLRRHRATTTPSAAT